MWAFQDCCCSSHQVETFSWDVFAFSCSLAAPACIDARELLTVFSRSVFTCCRALAAFCSASFALSVNLWSSSDAAMLCSPLCPSVKAPSPVLAFTFTVDFRPLLHTHHSARSVASTCDRPWRFE